MSKLSLSLRAGCGLLVFALLVLAANTPCAAQGERPDLLEDTMALAPFRLQLRPYVTMASNRRNIIGMNTRPGDARLFVTTEQGVIFAINEDAAGNGTAAQFFDVGAAVLAATGRSMNGINPGSSQRGLQSVAFHPDFNNLATPGYGKLYTTFLQNLPASDAGLNFLGDSVRGAPTSVTADGVLAEWTFNFATGQVPSNTHRELFRVKMPVYDHTIKQAKFNPYARPGDEDYGLLYLTHGDSNSKPSINDDPLLLSNALGKMIRINPLQSGSQRYTIPPTNPFANSSDSMVLKEIYTYGHRNPHTYSFNKGDDGQVHILVGEAGRNNIEEVNLIQAGGNFGWPDYEGTFLHLQQPDGPNSGYITDTDPLPADEATRGHVFPVAQYDHDAEEGRVSSGSAIATGFVIRNGSDPQFHNKFVFTDFSRRTTGDVFFTDFDEMLGAVNSLDPQVASRDEPSELTQAPVHLLKLALDHDRNPATAAQLSDDFLQLLGASRTDVRFGEGAYGQMYVSSKVNGAIYVVTNTLAPQGDFDADGAVAAGDFLLWQRDVGKQFTESPADANRDDVVDAADLAVWKANYGKRFDLPPVPLANAAPEPSAALLAIAAVACGLVRRRRPAVPRRIRQKVSCGSAALVALSGASLAMAQVTWNLTSTTNIGGHATTVFGSPQVVSTPFGTGLRFDGNDGVIVNTNPLVGATAFTMEMLLRPDANDSPTLDEPRILHVESLSPSGHRALLEGRIQGNLWHLDGFLRAPAASNPSTIASLTLIDPAKKHPVDQWYSYALVYDGTQLRVYLNGALELSGAIAVTTIASGQTSIGMRHTQERYFSGDVARVRFTPSALAPSALLSNRLPGDFNGDFYSAGGGIDHRDLGVWQSQFGGPGPFPNFGDNADGDGDGDVDGNDLLVWQRRLGAGPTPTAPTAVPEPGAASLALVVSVAALMGFRRGAPSP